MELFSKRVLIMLMFNSRSRYGTSLFLSYAKCSEVALEGLTIYKFGRHVRRIELTLDLRERKGACTQLVLHPQVCSMEVANLA